MTCPEYTQGMKPTAFTALTAAIAITLTACASNDEKFDEPTPTSQPVETQAETTPEDAYLAQIKAAGYTPYGQEDETIEQGQEVCSTLMSMVDMGVETSDGEPVGVTSRAINNADLSLQVEAGLDRETRGLILTSATDNLCPEAYDHMDAAAKATSPFLEHLND